MLDGRIYRGATGAAGELGHTLVGLDLSRPVPAAGAAFRSPDRSSTSRPATRSTGWRAEVANEQPESELGRLRRGGTSRARAGGRDRREQRGRRPARRVVEIWAEHLGIGIANAINTFDPEEVVIGGGAALAGELLLEPATRVARAYAVPGLGARTTIRLARHGVRAGVLGAAMLAIHELESVAGPEEDGGVTTIEERIGDMS